MNKSKHIGYRPTWAEVNLSNLAYNFKQIKSLLAPKTKIMVCVKADAYGHGIVPVAKKLFSLGVNYLGVASIDEGIKLREANIRLPVLILGSVIEKDIKPLFVYNLIPTVCTLEIACALNKIAKSMGKVMRIHIKVDTGMGRLGVLCKDALSFIREVLDFKFIKIEGVFTHLACADVNKNYTLHQIRDFKHLISQLRERGINIPLFHAANSMGTINYGESHFDMVRPGLAIYGLYPKEGLDIKLKAVLSLKTKIVYLKKVPCGFGISYGRTYITKRNTTIVTLPIGYGDGYARNLSNKAEVLIKGRRFKISGRICMDQIMVDVQDAKVNLGDEVVLIGSQKKDRITAEELALLSSTIPYEIVCGIGSRVPRIYTD
jgi:alanine racemase